MLSSSRSIIIERTNFFFQQFSGDSLHLHSRFPPSYEQNSHLQTTAHHKNCPLSLILVSKPDLCFIMTSTSIIDQDMMFEDFCDGIYSVGPDGLSVGSLDIDEALEFGFDFPVQTSTNAPSSRTVDTFEQPQHTAAWQPRMVSTEDMSPMRKTTTPRKQEDNLTPYDSLRLLVKNKQQGVKRSTEGHAVIEDDSEPSPTPKRRKATDPSLLHRACSGRNLSLESVQGILREDPGAASRQHTLFKEEKVYNYISHRIETKKVRESYTYPLNMALEKAASAAVTKSLIEADKDVLARKDGLEQEGSLHILLKHQSNNTNTVDAILMANPSSVFVEDRHFNTPLHVACRSGASMDVIRHLLIIYPEALTKRNFHGLTPLDVARNNSHMCNDGVASFLWQKVLDTDPTL
jgi:hypothetical protein